MPTRVLVVDDEPAIRELLGEYLRGRGLDVAVAADGEEARARLEREAFDLVATDLELPGVDGIEVLRCAAARGVPAILITAFGTVESAVEAHAAGALDYLSKPFRLREVYASVERALATAARDRRRAWAEAAFELVVAAESARDGEAADALVPRLSELLGALPPAETAEAPASEWKPLGATRWIEVPPGAEAAVLVAAVHGALVRNHR